MGKNEAILGKQNGLCKPIFNLISALKIVLYCLLPEESQSTISWMVISYHIIVSCFV